MSTSRKTHTPDERPAVRDDARLYVLSRTWLIALVALALVPWAVMTGLFVRGGRAAVEAAPPGGGLERANGGPWGTLTTTSILISPPLELVAEDWGREPDSGKYWFFPETSTAAAETLLASAGLTAAQVSQLLATAQPEPRIRGVVMLPSPDLLRGLPPDVRGRLYTRLAASPHNVNIAHAFRFAGATPADWMGRAAIAPGTRSLVEGLIYRHGRHLFLADIDLLQSLVTDAAERRQLGKAILQQNAVRVKLEVGSPDAIPGLVEYWGRGGRRLDIRPLIESVAGAGPGADRSIDVVHLLPSLAREHLYRYPRLTALDLDRPLLANCLWTALNFFEPEPDDGMLDVGRAIARLKQDYYLVENSPEFGDIIVMVDERGNIFHAVNYLADDLVFTKNGVSPMAPWVILPLDDVIDYYRLRSEKPELLIHRRKEF